MDPSLQESWCLCHNDEGGGCRHACHQRSGSHQVMRATEVPEYKRKGENGLRPSDDLSHVQDTGEFGELEKMRNRLAELGIISGGILRVGLDMATIPSMENRCFFLIHHRCFFLLDGIIIIFIIHFLRNGSCRGGRQVIISLGEVGHEIIIQFFKWNMITLVVCGVN
jgi:hypothetical protein